jgi:hypothetical protein
MGWPAVTDLGPQAVAYNWVLSGGDTFLGSGTELRVARLDGSRARLAQAGWSDGACGGTVTRSPSVSGLSVLYGYTSGGCGGGHSFRRFDLVGARRFAAPVSGPFEQVSLGWDGGVVYWLRGTVPAADCRFAQSACELIRSHELALRAIKGGEAGPPIEVDG